MQETRDIFLLIFKIVFSIVTIGLAVSSTFGILHEFKQIFGGNFITTLSFATGVYATFRIMELIIKLNVKEIIKNTRKEDVINDNINN